MREKTLLKEEMFYRRPPDKLRLQKAKDKSISRKVCEQGKT
jgi:hypothetical protein